MTRANAWFGEQYQRGTELAVDDLNARGGVLGQGVELIVSDDACNPDQAVALARKLVRDGVVSVARPLRLALLNPGLESLRGGRDSHDCSELGQFGADRDAKLYEIGAGTSEIRRRLIGRELFEATG